MSFYNPLNSAGAGSTNSNSNPYNIYEFPTFSFDTSFERDYLERVQKEKDRIEQETRMRENLKNSILADDLLSSSNIEDTSKINSKATTVELPNEPVYQYNTSTKSNPANPLPPIPSNKSPMSSHTSSTSNTPIPSARSSSSLSFQQSDNNKPRSNSTSGSYAQLPNQNSSTPYSSSQVPHAYSNSNFGSQNQSFSTSRPSGVPLPAIPNKVTSPLSQYSSSFTTDRELFCYQKCLELGYSPALSSFAVSAYLVEDVKVFDFITKVQQLETLGFAMEQAKEALLVADREFNAALDYLSNPK